MHTNPNLNGKTFPYRWWSVLGMAVLLLVAICAHWIRGEWGDKFWLLETAKLWLSGKHFYHDIFQPNLPMIFWLYSLPVWLSQHTGLENQHWLVLLTLALVGISVWVCHRLMRHHPYFATHPDMQVRHGVLLLFTLVFLVKNDVFADREHLMMLFMFPFLLRHMPSLAQRPMSLWLRLVVACLAAISPCIKPHMLLFLGGVYLIRMIRERSLRVLFTAEVLAIAGILALYLLLLCLTTSGYITIVLPMLLATYSANTNGMKETLMYYVTFGFMLALTLADFRLRYTSPLRQDILYFLMLCALGLGYVLTNNGWGYTFYPLYTLLVLVTGWIYWEFKWLRKEYAQQGRDTKSFRSGAIACCVNIAVNLLNVFILHGGFLYLSLQADGHSTDPGDANIVTLERMIKAESIQRIGTISIGFIDWGLQARKTNVQMSTRFNCIFMLPVFFSRDETFARTHEWIPRYVAEAYAEDLNNNKPELMLVDDTDNFAATGKKVDLVGYLSRYPVFAEAWKQYSFLETLDACGTTGSKQDSVSSACRITLYRRNTAQ